VIILDLSCLYDVDNFPIHGGGKSVSLHVHSKNGKVGAKSSGAPLKKKVIKKGATTTYIYTAGNSRATVTTGKADASKSIKSLLSEVASMKLNFDLW